MVFERKSEPEFRIAPSRNKTKNKFLISTSCVARGSKTDPKMHPEIHKNRSLAYVFITRKTTQFQKHFFLDFPAFREARTLKITPKRCTVVQNRRYHRFLEKRTLLKNTSKSDPQATPETAQNRKNTTGPPPKTHSKKKSKKTEK